MPPNPETLRALSLWQPWASALGPRPGQKHLETRSWETRYRGWLAIHAARRWTAAQWQVLEEEETGPWLRAALELNGYGGSRAPGSPPPPLPFGALVAVAWLAGCLPTDQNRPPVPECYLGDYRPGRYIWVFRDIRVLSNPIPARGALGIFRLTPELTRQVVIASALDPTEEA